MNSRDKNTTFSYDANSTRLSVEGDALRLSGLHVDGDRPNKFGSRDLLRLARELRQSQGARVVVVEGGIRTTGASPGHLPRPIIIKLK